MLFAVSFSRLLKMTVGCNPLLQPGIHASANHSFMQLVSCPLARGSQNPPPMHIAGVSEVSGTAVSLPLPGWCGQLAGHSFLPCSSPRFSLHKHWFWRARVTVLVTLHYEVLLLCLCMHTSRRDLNYNRTMPLAWAPKGFSQLTTQSPLGAWLGLFWPQSSAFTSHLLVPALLFPACQVPFNTACWFCSPHHVCPNLICPSVSLVTISSRKPSLNPLKQGEEAKYPVCLSVPKFSWSLAYWYMYNSYMQVPLYMCYT